MRFSTAVRIGCSGCPDGDSIGFAKGPGRETDMRRAGHSRIGTPAPVGRGHGLLTAALAVALIATGALGAVTAPLAQGKNQAQGREAKAAPTPDVVSIAVGNVIGEWAVLYEYDEIPLTPEFGRAIRKDRAFMLRPGLLGKLKRMMATRRRVGDVRISLRTKTRGNLASTFRELLINKEGRNLVFRLPANDELARLEGAVGLKVEPNAGYFKGVFWFWAARLQSAAAALGVLAPDGEFYVLKGRHKDPWPLIRDSGGARGG